MGLTVEALRAKYPEPKRTSTAEALQDDSYCVGGALLKELGWYATSCGCPGSPTQENGRLQSLEMQHRPECDGIEVGMFPSPLILAHGLRVANHRLNSAQARAFATLIVRKNDTGNFETAWGLVADALAWTDESWTSEDDKALNAWARSGS